MASQIWGRYDWQHWSVPLLHQQFQILCHMMFVDICDHSIIWNVLRSDLHSSFMNTPDAQWVKLFISRDGLIGISCLLLPGVFLKIFSHFHLCLKPDIIPQRCLTLSTSRASSPKEFSITARAHVAGKAGHVEYQNGISRSFLKCEPSCSWHSKNTSHSTDH